MHSKTAAHNETKYLQDMIMIKPVWIILTIILYFAPFLSFEP